MDGGAHRGEAVAAGGGEVLGEAEQLQRIGLDGENLRRGGAAEKVREEDHQPAHERGVRIGAKYAAAIDLRSHEPDLRGAARHAVRRRAIGGRERRPAARAIDGGRHPLLRIVDEAEVVEQRLLLRVECHGKTIASENGTKIQAELAVNMLIGDKHTMSDNVLIPLTGFTLPTDFPWRVRFIAAVDEHLQRLRATGHFVPARFFGYYFRGNTPVSVSGNWTVTLDLVPPISQLPEVLDYVTQGKYSISSSARDQMPEHMLVHDRRDGSCWLWKFEEGLRFVEATDPVMEVEDSGVDGAQNPKFLGP